MLKEYMTFAGTKLNSKTGLRWLCNWSDKHNPHIFSHILLFLVRPS